MWEPAGALKVSDEARPGTTTLFGALNTLEGTVIGTCYPRQRNIEFRKFLRQIDARVPAELDIHLIRHPQTVRLDGQRREDFAEDGLL